MAALNGVVFDAYGTLFDVHSIGRRAEELFPQMARPFRPSGVTNRLNTPGSCPCPTPHRGAVATTSPFGT